MTNNEFEGTITYVNNAKRSINDQLEDAIHNMNDEQFRAFIIAYLETKRSYEDAVTRALYESQNLGLVTSIAEATQVHSRAVYNIMSETMAPKTESTNLESMFK